MRPIRTRFRSASGLIGLRLAVQSNSPAHYAKSTPSPRRAPTACKRMISGTLSLRSSRCFSSFSRLTSSLSVIEEYLALEGGPPIFNPGFPSPSLIHGLTRLPLQDFHLLRCVIQTLRRSSGLSAFDRLYSRNRCCFLFLCLLRCFTSARSLLTPIHSE